VPEDFLAMFIPESANSLVTTIFDENYKFNNAPEGSGLIHTFTAGWRDDELADLSEEDRTKRVMEEIEMFFPGFSERAQLVHCCRSGRAVNLEGPGQFVAIEDLRDNHWDDVEGLYLGGEYLFLIACTEGSWATGKEAAERLISKL
jgi:protoporphyrinogen oxidase